jgi:hypothetical protein
MESVNADKVAMSFFYIFIVCVLGFSAAAAVFAF